MNRVLQGSALSLLVLLPACTSPDGDRPRVARADSAGIEVVSVSGDLAPASADYSQVAVLGGADRGPESFYRIDRTTVAVGPDDHIHVLDRMNHRIARFTSSGDFVDTIGQRGQGPAEFMSPFSISVDADGVMTVADRSRGELQRITADGTTLPSIRVAAPIHGSAEVALVGATPVFLWWNWIDRSSGVHQLVWGSDGLPVVAEMRVEGSGRDTRFTSCPAGFPGAPYLDPGLLWATSEAGAVVVPSHDYEVRVLSPDGVTERIIRRDAVREPATSELLLAHLPDTFRANTGRGPDHTCPVPLEEAIRVKGHLDGIPAVDGVAISDEGEIWIRRGAVPVGSGEIDVYDRDGTPRGTLPTGTPLPVAFTERGLLSIRSDEFGVERLVVWEEGPGAAEAAQEGTPVRTRTADGVELFGELHTAGLPDEAPLVLLFHQGGSSGAGEYEPLVGWLNAGGYRAIHWDQRAGGDIHGVPNRTAAGLDEDTPAGFCDASPDLKAALDHVLAEGLATEVIVWGSSYSGALAFQLTAENPDRVSALLAFSPASGDPMEGCRARRWLDDLAVPAAVFTPTSESVRPSVIEQRDLLLAAGVDHFIVENGVHGSSMLVDARTGEGMSATRDLVVQWIGQAIAR